jgi:predicted transcriptional regulator
MTKQDILKALADLPEDASIEDAIDRLVYLYKIERGIQDAHAGKKITQEEAKARMAQWLS